LAAAAVTFRLLPLLLLSVSKEAADVVSIFTPTMVTFHAFMMMPVSFMGGSGASTDGPVIRRGSLRRSAAGAGAGGLVLVLVLVLVGLVEVMVLLLLLGMGMEMMYQQKAML
jgi:hypothetical protein